MSRTNLPSIASLDAATINQLTPSECTALIAQIDQQLVNTLQAIDADFLKCTSIITDKILPQVEAYGQSSHRIWQSVKWWKNFYELAAGIKLSNPHQMPEDSVADQFIDRSNVTVQADTTLGDTPRKEDKGKGRAKSGTEKSPYELLQDEARQHLGIETSGASSQAPSFVKQQTSRLQDLSFDSPDIIRPDLETLSLGSITRKEPESPLPARGLKPTKKASYNNLSKQARAGPSASTPARPRVHLIDHDSIASNRFPSNAGPGWDGLADLSKTPLSAFKSPYAASSRANRMLDDSDIIVPKFRSQSMAGQFAKTPERKGKSKLEQDFLDATQNMDARLMDSPDIEPPSVMKNWHTRTYGSAAKPKPPQFTSSKVPASAQAGITAPVTADQSYDDSGDLVDAWGQSFEDEGEDNESRDDMTHFTAQEESLEYEEGVDQPDTLFGGFRKSDGLTKLDGFLKRTNPEMNTMHGGHILDSSPSADSPLRGRDRVHQL